jgi:hypothetical protein
MLGRRPNVERLRKRADVAGLVTWRLDAPDDPDAEYVLLDTFEFVA